MKAQDRHKLKTNELAESLKELPEYWHKHGNKIVTVGIAALVLVVAGLWWHNTKTTAARGRLDLLQSLLTRKSLMQLQAAQAAQLGEAGSSDPTAALQAPYNAGPVAASLATLAQEEPDGGLGITALIQQADAIRSNLVFSNRATEPQLARQQRDRAAHIYEDILQRYPDKPAAVGASRLGLALLAEDKADWATAKGNYEEIIAQADGLLTGTVYPTLAQRRLQLLDEFSEPIEFLSTASQPIELPLPAIDSTSATALPVSVEPEPASAATIDSAASDAALEVDTAEMDNADTGN